MKTIDMSWPPIRFRRAGKAPWVRAVDEFNAAALALSEFERRRAGVVYLHPEREHAERLRAFRKAGCKILEHPDQPRGALPNVLRLMAVLMGDTDPNWLLPEHVTDMRQAVQMATYRSALRRLAAAR